MARSLSTVAAVVLVLVIASSAGASSLTLERSFLNPSPHANDLFGMAVSLDGGKALVGANLDGTTGSGSGRAYIFDVATGALLRTLENPTPGANDFFGQTVSLSGNLALVGAQGDDTGLTNSGAAYLFNATTGALLRTFLNPTPAVSDAFGLAVSISGNRALISATGDDTGASNAGAAYLFDTATGALLRTFLNPTPAATDNFGFSVSLLGDRALIGSANDDTGAMNAGSVYLFDTTTGTLLRTFNNPTPFLNDMFGTDIALSSSRALIGAPQDDTRGFNEGAAYLYDLLTGNLLYTLLIPNQIGDSEFLGEGVALSDDWALVGAGFRNKGAPTTQQDLGGAFLWDVNTGLLLQELVDPLPTRGDRYGMALALDGSTALIAAQTDFVAGISSGQVFYYSDPTGPVPEPATVGLMAAGLASLVASRRRRQFLPRSRV